MGPWVICNPLNENLSSVNFHEYLNLEKKGNNSIINNDAE
jgi:hypothetical protein